MKTLLITISLLLAACGSDFGTVAAAGGEYGEATGGTAELSTGGTTAVGGATVAATGGTESTTGGTTAVGGATVAATGGTESTTGGTTAVGGDAAGGAESTMGPTMVQIGSYWIDSTEVSQGQYLDWIASNPVIMQPAECTTNTDLTPSYLRLDGTDAQLPVTAAPVTGIDWCDAYAFCAAAGKRLCGAVGGAATDPSVLNSVADEWFNSCSSGGVYEYSDGAQYDFDTACNVEAIDLPVSTTLVGEIAACSSPVPAFAGVYDLTGNVEEWTNSCDATGCAVRGGSYASKTSTCSRAFYVDRMTNGPTAGFRCCKD